MDPQTKLEDTKMLNEAAVEFIITTFKIKPDTARGIIGDFGYDVSLTTLLRVVENVSLYEFLIAGGIPSIVRYASIAEAIAQVAPWKVILLFEGVKSCVTVSHRDYGVFYKKLIEYYVNNNIELPTSDVYQIVGVNAQQRLVFFTYTSVASVVDQELVRLRLKYDSTIENNCQIYIIKEMYDNRAETTEIYGKITNSLQHIPVWRDQLIRDEHSPENDATKHYLGVIKDLTSISSRLITPHATLFFG